MFVLLIFGAVETAILLFLFLFLFTGFFSLPAFSTFFVLLFPLTNLLMNDEDSHTLTLLVPSSSSLSLLSVGHSLLQTSQTNWGGKSKIISEIMYYPQLLN